MDPAIWMVIIFVALLIIRVPIAISLGMTTIFVSLIADKGLGMISYNFFGGISKFPLLAIPFFIMAGVIMQKARMAEKIINFVKLIVGPIPGGLAIATVIVATFWGAVSGSGPATVAALGVILIPGMVKQGYDKDFATAVTSVSSGLAIIIPPSIAFIVYGMIANVSIGTLFAAGIIPGALVALGLITVVFIISKKRGYKGEEWGTLSELWDSFKDAFWAFLTPVIILGGIYGGVFTPTEAAAVAVFYGLFVGVFVYKTINFKILFKIGVDAAETTAVVMLVVTAAGLFSWIATNVGLIQKASGAILGLSDNPVIILLFINIIILFAGMVIDAISIYYVFLPILLPIMAEMGWDPVWFGVIMTINLAIGQVTPPVAVNLYVGSNIANISLEKLAKQAIPLILAAVVVLLILMYLPGLTTFLPKVFGLY
ncbi:C4-dicarboxylate transporter DctM subunit [Halanaerobium sp. DL-01]|uniref:TRAP transporter large permease n=1 Tax=Halanaerobium sp. DL-01 TaxID=1653064 RepID=UPI000DF2FA01|nr:TRAP transporter large permease [Halanaerobium sp. DL-01]RCW86613.1 C4-dicarboxylate transporter DctM subunit [Halanaerobium sp. DL-01]